MKPFEFQNYEGLTAEESFIINWQFRRRDRGDFAWAFVEAAKLADEENLAALAKGFPTEISALHRYWTESGWWPTVVQKAVNLGILPPGAA